MLLAHHLLAHGWALARDVDRLLATVARLDVSPLGAGALAGTSLPIDPAATAAELGFARPFDNSLDAVSDRDFVAEALFDLALLGIHLSRIGEEFVLWTSEEFGFARLDDAYATGSSMLPQKKNPDIAELARGKAGRLIGNLTGLAGDAQGPAAGVQPRPAGGQGAAVRLRRPGRPRARRDRRDDRHRRRSTHARMAAAADVETTAATDLAEWLVVRGTPFREAHAIVGDLVRRHVESGDATAPTSSPPIRASARRRPPSSRPASPCRGERRRAAPARTPWAAQLAAFRELLAGEIRAIEDAVTYRHTLRIRYAECDMQGIVFNAHYLAYCDDAFGAWVETVDAEAMDFVGNDGSFDVMVKKAVVTWHGAVRFGETLDLDCAVSRWGRSSFDVRFDGSVAGAERFDVVVTYVNVKPVHALAAHMSPTTSRSALGVTLSAQRQCSQRPWG